MVVTNALLTQAQAQLAMAEATLKEVETAGSYASIRAPFDGEVVSRCAWVAACARIASGVSSDSV